MPKYDNKGQLKTVNQKSATKYDGQAFERFLEHCHQGGSIPEFCRNERISRPCFDDWIDKYDTKKEIKAKGKLWAEGWWIQKARDNLITETVKDFDSNSSCTTHFNTTLYKFYVGGRFGHTADKDANERLDKIEEHMRSSAQPQLANTAYAAEAECEENEQSKSD